MSWPFIVYILNWRDKHRDRVRRAESREREREREAFMFITVTGNSYTSGIVASINCANL